MIKTARYIATYDFGVVKGSKPVMDKYARTGVHDGALVWQCSFCGLTFDNLEQCKSSRRARIGKVLCNKDLSVCRFFCEYILFLKLDSTHLFLSVNGKI